MKQRQINYPKINNNDIKVLGRVVTITSANKLAPAEQVFDQDFDYDDLDRYSWDNIVEAGDSEGMDQYTINRLFGKKLKKWDDIFKLDPNDESWILLLKVRNLIADNLEVNNDAHIHGNLEVDHYVRIHDDLTVDGETTTTDLHVTNNSQFDGDVNITGDLIVNNINIGDAISGEDKTSPIWLKITELENRIKVLEDCCKDMHNNPTGVSITIEPNPINVKVGGADASFEVVSSVPLADNPTVSIIDGNEHASIVNGKVHAISEGTATIQAQWHDFNGTATIIVSPADPIYHTVTFNVNGGTPQIAPVQVLDGQPVTRPANPTKEGYTFNIWMLDGTNLGWGFTNPVREDITLNADWVENSALPNVYTVTFDANGGSPTPADQTLEENQSVVIPTEPTREGYVFVAWCVGTENGEAYDFNIPVSSNLHLVAKWGLAEEYSIQLSKHTMTFDDYGQEMLSVIQNENKPENVSWSSSDSSLAMFIANPDGNGKVGRVVCSATAGTNTTVTITCTGVTSGLSDTCVVTINIPAETPQEPTYTVTYKDCHPNHNYTVGDNSFKQYAVPLVTQTYHAGDTVTPPNEAAVKTALTNAAFGNQDPWSRQYDTLVGWNNLPYGQIMPAENIIVYAIWELHQENPTAGYRLVIKPDFSNQPETDPDWSQDGNDYVLHQGGTGLVTLWAQNTEDPSDEYTVSGNWSSDRNTISFTSAQGTYCNFTDTGSDILNATTFTITASHPDFKNATLTVKLMPAIKYTLTFDTNGGSAIAPVQYKYGDTISPVTPPTKSGMIFAGWSPSIPATMPRLDVTVIAQWSDVDSYIVQFDHNAWSIYQPFEPVYVEVTLANGYPEDIIWTSSNRNVAIVEPENSGTNRQEGCIYAVGNGSAVIRGTGVISGKYDEVAVTVELLNLSYDKVTVSMDTDTGSDEKVLPTTTYGAENTPVSVTWTSSDESVATVRTEQSPMGTTYKIHPVSPGTCYFEASYTSTASGSHESSNHLNTARVYIIVKQTASSNPEGTLVELSPYHAVLSNGQSQTITASTIGVDLANDYEWVLKAYPQNMVTITPSVGNSSCTVTASNTPGFAEIWLKPISDNEIGTHLYGPGLIKAGTIIEVQ